MRNQLYLAAAAAFALAPAAVAEITYRLRWQGIRCAGARASRSASQG